ncbi:hypothetical protein JXA31_08080 [Candidatus Bathyarchaeota archaeon]|nr:hypothetical protein [Candidatus Bathyarchaeota archaeon]
MESESERISYSTNAAPSKNRFKLIAIVAVAAVSVVIGALLVSAFISSPQGQDAWLFKGAYAKYEGSASISAEDLGSMLDMSMSIDFTVRQEIVDFNSTHALVSTSFQMSSSLGEFGGETVEDENSTWVPLSEMGLMNAFEDVDLTNSYESTVSITGLGTRTCMVYEYAIAEEGLTITVYVDKNIDWPLKMTISMTNTELPSGDLEVDINLTETNIPALQ